MRLHQARPATRATAARSGNSRQISSSVCALVARSAPVSREPGGARWRNLRSAPPPLSHLRGGSENRTVVQDCAPDQPRRRARAACHSSEHRVALRFRGLLRCSRRCRCACSRGGRRRAYKRMRYAARQAAAAVLVGEKVATLLNLVSLGYPASRPSNRLNFAELIGPSIGL